MSTSLIQQATRATDPEFVAQVGAALARDIPDMLRATGAFADVTDSVLRSRFRFFAQRVVDDRERTVGIVAHAVAGENAIVAIDPLPGPPVAYTVTDATLIIRVRVVVRALADGP